MNDNISDTLFQNQHDNALSDDNSQKNSNRWWIQLYVTATNETSRKLADILDGIMQKRVVGSYTIDVVDVMENPQKALDNDVMATPCLIRKKPSPERRVIGNLTKIKLVALGLGIPENNT